MVISTHPFGTQMTSYLKRKGKINCKLATILTDFAPHDQWLVGNKYGDYFFVSNNNMKTSLVNDFKIPYEKVFVTGIPLSSKFSSNFNKDEIYKIFNLSPNKKQYYFSVVVNLGLEKVEP